MLIDRFAAFMISAAIVTLRPKVLRVTAPKEAVMVEAVKETAPVPAVRLTVV